MGTIGRYRQFISDYATIKKGKPFEFTKKVKESFDRLKLALFSSPVLVHPDFTRRIFIQCEASNMGIAYFFQKLTFRSEREVSAVVMVIKKSLPYIELLTFSVITDHTSLKWIMSQKDVRGRLSKWSLHM